MGVLLAEAVIGWGARRYLDTRPGRSRAEEGTHGGAARHGGGRRRLLPGTPGAPALHRRIPGGLRSSRTLLTGVGLASAGLLATVLVASLWSTDDGVDPAASTSANGGLGGPDTGSPSPPTASSGTARLPAAPGRTRLRNAEDDLCLDITGKPKKGAGTELAACSTARTQQWSYENDGLLRSVADPDLCLDSHVDAGVVVLGGCVDEKAKRADDVRYDLTVRGSCCPAGTSGSPSPSPTTTWAPTSSSRSATTPPSSAG